MHIGNHDQFKAFLWSTKKELYWLLGLVIVPVLLYQYLGWKWLGFSWLPAAIAGIAILLLFAFKTVQTYSRLWEARKLWDVVVNSSRSWGMMIRDFVNNNHRSQPLDEEVLSGIHREMLYRHLAWLTALRFQLRKSGNKVKRNVSYKVPEYETNLSSELKKYLAPQEIEYILSKRNRATQLISLQSMKLGELYEVGLIDDSRHMELQRCLQQFNEAQGKSERISNFPYPGQGNRIYGLLVWAFTLLFPCSLLNGFAAAGPGFIWLTVPISLLIGWMVSVLRKMGEATANPFEGGSNDIPVTALSRTIEIDLREMLDETNIPPALKPENGVLM